MATVMMLENVLASMALMETGVTHVARNFLDFHTAKVFFFSIFQKIIFSLYSHFLDLDLNGLLTRHNFWRILGMLGNYTIPKWKEFLKSRKLILRKSYLSTFIHIMVQKIFDFHAWVKNAILAIFENSEKLPNFLPMHSKMYSFDAVNNSPLWFLHKVPQAPSMCLFMWIKMDK
jgi:hypothetical protein